MSHDRNSPAAFSCSTVANANGNATKELLLVSNLARAIFWLYYTGNHLESEEEIRNVCVCCGGGAGADHAIFSTALLLRLVNKPAPLYVNKLAEGIVLGGIKAGCKSAAKRRRDARVGRASPSPPGPSR